MAAVLLVTAAACGPAPAVVAHGRRGSWQRIEAPTFSAGPSYGIAGLMAPGDGFPAWAAAGSVRDGRTRAVVWTSADGSRWSRADLDQGDARESVATAGARRAGVAVVVGTVITRLGDRDGRIWMSRDGSVWSVTNLPGGGRGDQSVTSVAGGPLGFVAAGADGAVPAVWWSPDGFTWTRSVGAFEPADRIEAVAVGARGVVAVGTITTGDDVDGAVWFSTDGISWRAVPLGAAGFTGRTEQAVHAVTATSGGFVAVGDDDAGERRVAVVWTSADGVTWQRQPASPDMAELPGSEDTEGVSARSVAGPGPVVAVGGGFGLQVWTSPDGRRWTRDDPPVTGSRTDNALVAGDGSAVLIASAGSLWFRRAGGRWADVGSDASAFPRSSESSTISLMVRVGDRLVAYGRDDGDKAVWFSSDGRVWQRQAAAESALHDGSGIDALTTFAGVTYAVGTARRAGTAGDSVAAVWRSENGGTTWERADAANPAFFVKGSTQMFGVAAGPRGVVAVGLAYDVGQTIDAHAWFSPDGRSWRAVAEPAAWSAAGDQYLGHVCALPDGGFVAMGASVARGQHDSWTWVSADGVNWEQSPGGGARVGSDPPLAVSSCTTTPAGVIVAGNVPGRGGRDGMLLRTTDGRSWTALGGRDGFSDDLDDGLLGVAVDGDRMVVSGYVGSDISVYGSADGGLTWTKHTALSFGGMGTQQGSRLALAGDEVVMAGYDGASAAVWIGPAP